MFTGASLQVICKYDAILSEGLWHQWIGGWSWWSPLDAGPVFVFAQDLLEQKCSSLPLSMDKSHSTFKMQLKHYFPQPRTMSSSSNFLQHLICSFMVSLITLSFSIVSNALSSLKLSQKVLEGKGPMVVLSALAIYGTVMCCMLHYFLNFALY